MRRFIFRIGGRMLCPLIVFAIIVLLVPQTAVAGGGVASCHCPCHVSCGPGVSCDCKSDSEDCHYCSCGSVTIVPKQLPSLLGIANPVLQDSFSSWFDFEQYSEIKVGFEATMSDTGQKETWVFRFVPDPVVRLRYVTDSSSDSAAYATWRGRVNTAVAARVAFAGKDDPATSRIVDGDLNHLNQSLNKRFSVVAADGSEIPVWSSYTTLGWEMVKYAQGVVAGIETAAFRAGQDANQVRTQMYGIIKTVDLMIKAGNRDGALSAVDDLINRTQNEWLGPAHSDTQATLCGFGKLRNLLSPRSLCL